MASSHLRLSLGSMQQSSDELCDESSRKSNLREPPNIVINRSIDATADFELASMHGRSFSDCTSVAGSFQSTKQRIQAQMSSEKKLLRQSSVENGDSVEVGLFSGAAYDLESTNYETLSPLERLTQKQRSLEPIEERKEAVGEEATEKMQRQIEKKMRQQVKLNNAQQRAKVKLKEETK